MTDKLSRREKLMYGVGDIGFSLSTTILGLILPFSLLMWLEYDQELLLRPSLLGELGIISTTLYLVISLTAHVPVGGAGGHFCCLAHCPWRLHLLCCGGVRRGMA